jgi:hypothetical protein
MYWWKASKLAVDFREGRVDEKERFKYYLATIIAWNIVVQTVFRYGEVSWRLHLLFALVILIANVVGIVLCFRANKKGDDTDFISRMICLGWPVGIRLAVIFGAFILVLVFVESLPTKPVAPQNLWSTILETLQRRWNTILGTYGMGVIWLYYSGIYDCLNSIAQERGAENLIQAQKAGWTPGRIAFPVLAGSGAAVMLMAMGIAALDFGEYNQLGGLISISAVALWLLMFVCILVWVQRSFAKHT